MSLYRCDAPLWLNWCDIMVWHYDVTIQSGFTDYIVPHDLPDATLQCDLTDVPLK